MRHFHFAFLGAFVCAAFLAVPLSGSAQYNYWTSTVTGANWAYDGNWSLGHAPLAGEDAAITNIGVRTVILSGSTPQLASFRIAVGTLVFTNWTTTLNADYVHVDNGGKLTLPAAFTNNGVSNRISIVCGSMLVATGGQINADGRGYAQQSGPGASATVGTLSSGGAGHGGIGGVSGHNYSGGVVYNTASNPVIPGSGAGKSTSCSGGPGGGAIRIEASGQLTVNGTITANGGAGSISSSRDGGGGAGGAVLLVCNTFSGTNGVIRANGARTSSLAGGGGGGRIALHYAPAAQALLDPPAVNFSVQPGGGYSHKERFRMADWGTLFFTDASGVFRVINAITGFNGHIVIPGGIGTFAADSLTLTDACLGFEEDPFVFQIANGVTIATNGGLLGRGATTLICSTLTNNGIVKLGSNSTVSIAGDLSMTNSEFDLRFYSALTASGNWEAAGAATIISLEGADTAVTGSMRLASGALLQVIGAPTNGTPGAWGARFAAGRDIVTDSSAWIHPYSDGVNGGSPIFQCRNFLAGAGSGINGDGRGYAQDKGPGAGTIAGTDPAGGGGYGGSGGYSSSGRAGGNPYGDRVAPIQAGSGGGHTTSVSGGPGGGVIRIEASERILVNGTLSANGSAGVQFDNRDGGGGAGGSVYLLCDTFAGTNGLIRADGGRGSWYEAPFGGGGGGGRISLQYNPSSQAAMGTPTVRFTVNPGYTFSSARLWQMPDWGTLCFPDAQHVFQFAETLSDFGGYLAITGGLSSITLDRLTLANAWIGMDEDAFPVTISGALTVKTNAAFLVRNSSTFNCGTITNEGVVRMGTGNVVNVTGGIVASNSLFSMLSDSVLTVGQDFVMMGPAGLVSLEGLDATIGQNLLVQSGAAFSAFAKATNGTPWAWGMRLTAQQDIGIETGGWIHSYSEPSNGGSPLFRCRNMAVAANSGINADGKGFAPGKGSGAGTAGSTSPSGGGGHGGRGGNSSSGKAGGSPNGLPLFPRQAGSGGGTATGSYGGAGGGVIRVEAENGVTLNGTFTADGLGGGATTAREGGGGAGGGIFVIAGTFTGGVQSFLSARGGASYTSSGGTIGGGGGGGGRIAVWTRSSTGSVAQSEANTNRLIVSSVLASFDGSAWVNGGTGYQAGTNGTLSFVLPGIPGTLILVK